MNLPRNEDAPHKFQMYRLLTAILSESKLSQQLVFKGGTCAVLRGWLDRFSVDLDFDLIQGSNVVTQSMAAYIGQQMKKPMVALIPDIYIGQWIKNTNHATGPANGRHISA